MPTLSPSDLDEIDLDTLDLTDVSLFDDGPPHELFARMRAERPVHWNATASGRGFWNITKAADIERISRDAATFSSYVRGPHIEEDQPWPLEFKRMTMLAMDPPDHTRQRRIVGKVFTPKRIADLEGAIRERIARILANVRERGECDFVADVAVELPLQVIAEMLGVPNEDRMMLFEWTNLIEHAMTDPAATSGMAAFQEMAGYLTSLLIERRQRPTGDLISALCTAEVDGVGLDDTVLTAIFGLLMFAGNDTTRNTASGGLHALIEHPEQHRKLRENPELLPGAIEEMLRWATPVNHFRRTATIDTEIGGVPISADDGVVMWYCSGNRDEEAVPHPTVFDVTRKEVAHSAFGAGGRHFCLGAPLGRLQLRLLFEALLPQMENIALAGEPEKVVSNWAAGLTKLPITFTPFTVGGLA